MRSVAPCFRALCPLLYLRTLVKSTLEMAALSTARKLSILARVAVQQAGRTRTLGALLNAGRTTAAHFRRVLGQLWLEVTGFVFLVLSGIGALAFVREWTKRKYAGMGHGE